MTTSESCALRLSLLSPVLVVFLLAFATVIRAEDYLTAVKVTAIGTGSVTINQLGEQVKSIDITDKSVIRGTLPKEMALQRLLGGRYYPGKTNFLDNWTGSAITPITFGLILAGADATWPQRHSVQDVSQDMYLYITGLLTNKGLTDLSKGFFRRPRPVTFMADSAVAGLNKSAQYFRTAFFSGHTSSSFFSAAFLNLRLRSIMRQRLAPGEYRDWRWAPPSLLLGWASFVGWSRIHAYKHFPSDVFIGALIGYLVAELFYSWTLTDESYKGPGRDATVFRVSFNF